MPIVPVVGFDLDMTLVDSRARITGSLRAALAAAGADVTEADVFACVGLPLEVTLARLAPGHDAATLASAYRQRHDSEAARRETPVTALPGAADALRAVRAAGGRTVVVSAKLPEALVGVLREAGLVDLVDEVVGGRYAEAKGVALRALGGTAYVGDHPGDVRAARAASVPSLAVATGPHPASDLWAEGADTVADDLTGFAAWLEEHVLDLRLAALEHALARADSVLVAFSGGADSALLLAAAVRALGVDRVAAATGVSGSLADGELDDARELAGSLGVRLLSPVTREIDRPGYRANAGDRCFHCKAELLDVLAPLAAAHRLAHVATGTNADDVVAGFRPGIRAAAERGALTPLADAGLTKAQVRAASRRWGLPTHDKPAAACLSSRIAYGVRITRAGLARVDRAEQGARDALAAAGLSTRDLRVRDLGADRARLDVDRGLVADLAPGTPAGKSVAAALRAAGFADVEVDPRGFRSGSLNELLPDPAAHR